MGLFRCRNCCCFRVKWTPNDTPLQPLPKPREADETDGPLADMKEEPDILIIRNIDPCISINGPNHNTSQYEHMTRQIDPELVVRRGQTFCLEITLSRQYNPEKDGISFIFTVNDEEKPTHGSGTIQAVPLLSKPTDLPWNVVLQSSKEDILTVQIVTPPDAIVAKWRLDIDTKIIGGGSYCYSWSQPINILFNPWHKYDQVHMKLEEWRQETVLNDVGLIWRGTYSKQRPVIWKYDQFEKNVLECGFYLVNVVGKVRNNFRGDSVKVVRALAAAVNAVDDEGAVMGNWSTDHSGGTAPTKWLGSKQILQQYYKKKKPVKYGQCWVFSGVLTTICRALGIPARTVTNYSSAHDTQNSLTVDYFLDSKGEVLEDLNSDSVWNYHVWVETWMKRFDLSKDFNGWQAIDATPQETSEDMYRCGPASVAAVKRGEVRKPYDNTFLFSEVNADKIYWKYTGPNKPLKLLHKDINGIGKLICTKAPLKFEREDITLNYKFPEKTGEERSTMLKALRQSENLFARYYLNEEFNDVQFNLVLLDDIKIGQEFNVTLQVKNRSKEKNYKVNANIRVEAVTYTGKAVKEIKKYNYMSDIKANTNDEIKMPVTYQEYGKLLVDQCAFKISCLSSIEGTNFDYYAEDDFRVRKPDIKFKIKGKIVENKEASVEISVENSLPIEVKNGVFTVEGPGIDGALKLKVDYPVPAHGTASTQFKFTPTKIGSFTIAAKFTSKQLDDVDGYLVVNVEPDVAVSNEQ